MTDESKEDVCEIFNKMCHAQRCLIVMYVQTYFLDKNNKEAHDKIGKLYDAIVRSHEVAFKSVMKILKQEDFKIVSIPPRKEIYPDDYEKENKNEK